MESAEKKHGGLFTDLEVISLTVNKHPPKKPAEIKDTGDAHRHVFKRSEIPTVLYMSNARRQGIFWILTIPRLYYTTPTELPTTLQWIKGQQEIGHGGYEHWQLIIALKKKGSLSAVKAIFGTQCHGELTRSIAAGEYVWKDDTAVAGTRFEFGVKPIQRNSKIEWESVWTAAQSGDLMAIPAHVRVTSYRTIQCIRADFEVVPAMQRETLVFWGRTGTGKSRRAWDEAGLEAYSKDPRTKFWCGYQGQANVVLDEFRGGIDIAHLLRWLDRYPVRVEIKGGSRPLMAQRIWITSNLSPDDWYPEVDQETKAALRRRLTVTHFDQL